MKFFPVPTWSTFSTISSRTLLISEQSYCNTERAPYALNITHSVVLQAVNSIGGTERISDPVIIIVTTLPVGPPQVPAKPTVTLFNNTSGRISWMDPGQWGVNEKEVKRFTNILIATHKKCSFKVSS